MVLGCCEAALVPALPQAFLFFPHPLPDVLGGSARVPKGLLCLFGLSPSVMTRGTAFSPSYRFTLSDGTVLSAHTKCKLCYPSSPEMQPFIMGIHVIDRYVYGLALEL